MAASFIMDCGPYSVLILFYSINVVVSYCSICGISK